MGPRGRGGAPRSSSSPARPRRCSPRSSAPRGRRRPPASEGGRGRAFYIIRGLRELVVRIALKIAYDGTAFHGQARQPGLRTVEGEVIHALVRARVIWDAKSSSFQSASRTDAGVSALGNVVAFHSPLAPSAAGRAFNGKSRGVWAWAVAKVPDDFSARRARERWY